MDERKEVKTVGLDLNVTDLTYDAVEHEYVREVKDDDGEVVAEMRCKLGIRMWPESMNETTIKPDGVLVKADQQLRKFVYCLAWWKDVTINGKAASCTDEIKKMIFDTRADPGMVAFVLTKADEMKFKKDVHPG